MKKLLKYKYIMLLIVAYFAVYLFLPDVWERIGKMDFQSFFDSSVLFPAIFLLLGLIDVWVDKETMTKWMGEHSGMKGSLIAYLFGMIGVGALYIAFPVSIVFLKKGASVKNIYIFLGAWSTTKLTQILVEVGTMGIQYTILRFILNVAGIVIIAKIMSSCIKEPINIREV